MTTDAVCMPLIAQFATRLGNDRNEIFRYDPARQVSQLWNGREWVDTFEARRNFASGTRITRVSQESTDDA